MTQQIRNVKTSPGPYEDDNGSDGLSMDGGAWETEWGAHYANDESGSWAVDDSSDDNGDNDE